MKNCIKTELRKAICNPMFLLALTVGIAFILLDLKANHDEVQWLVKANLEAYEKGYGSGSFESCSLFMFWVPINGVTLGSRLFYMVWPILAAIPYGWSYCQERKKGLASQVAVRCGNRAYFLAKFIAVFVSGGLVIVLPVFLNLLMVALFCRDCIPMLGIVPIFSGNFLSLLYYSKPWVYAFCWCVMEFLFGGAAAVLCFTVGSKLRFQSLTILTPFILLMGFEMIATKLFQGAPYTISPIYMPIAASANPNPGWILFTALLSMTGIGIVAGYWWVVKHEHR